MTLSASPTSKQAGFTLLEVMVAFALFMIGMTSVVFMMVQAARMGESARNRLEAMHQARAQMENLLRLNFESPALTPGTHAVVSGDYSGFYTVSHREIGETKTVVMVMQYPSFRQVSTLELEGVISRALH